MVRLVIPGLTIARGTAWAGASFAIAGAIHSVLFGFASLVSGHPLASPIEVAGSMLYALFWWTALSPLTLSVLVVGALLWAFLCRSIGRGDDTHWGALGAGVVIGAVAVAAEVVILEHRTVAHSIQSALQGYYLLKWAALTLGLYLSRRTMKSLRPRCFYRDWASHAADRS
jgi:hypothetical protein